MEQIMLVEDILPIPRCKPPPEAILSLQEQKKNLRIAKLTETANLFEGFEYDLCKEIENLKQRGKNRQKRIKKIIDKIKEIQKQNNINEFQRSFLRNLLTTYSNINERTKRKILNEILKNAKCCDRVVTKQYLIKQKSKIGVEETKRQDYVMIKKFYSFT